MRDLSCENLWLNVDKPYGISSARVVAIIKKITRAKKVGHAGTLDPLATGVLPIAINKATRTCQYIVTARKKYYFEITWGEFRDTDDKEGAVTSTSKVIPTVSKIIAVLPNFLGKITQMPPQYSAVKLNGKKAYEIARSGEVANLKLREVEVYQINLIASNQKISAFEIECSKGTYIRSFARELAENLGVCGYISSLRRLEVGNFCVGNIISLDKLKNIVDYDGSDVALFKLRDVLSFMSEVELNDLESLRVKSGQAISLHYDSLYQGSLVKIINNNQVIGLGSYSGKSLRPVAIF